MSHPTPDNTPVLAAVTPTELATGWQNGLLRRMVLTDRKTVKLDRAVLLQLLALRDTPEQVVADLVSMFTETGE